VTIPSRKTEHLKLVRRVASVVVPTHDGFTHLRRILHEDHVHSLAPKLTSRVPKPRRIIPRRMMRFPKTPETAHKSRTREFRPHGVSDGDFCAVVHAVAMLRQGGPRTSTSWMPRQVGVHGRRHRERAATRGDDAHDERSREGQRPWWSSSSQRFALVSGAAFDGVTRRHRRGRADE